MSEYDELGWERIPGYGRFMQNKQTETSFAPLFLDYLFRVEPGSTLLDVACGAGTMAYLLEVEKVPVRYTGFDITPCYLEMAKKRFPQHTWVKGDARKLPFEDKQFDITFCVNLLLHLTPSDARKVLAELTRVTKKEVYLQSRFYPEGKEDTMPSEFIAEDGSQPIFLYNTTAYKELEFDGWEWHLLHTRLKRVDAENWPFKGRPFDRAVLDRLIGYLCGREGQYVVMERKA